MNIFKASFLQLNFVVNLDKIILINMMESTKQNFYLILIFTKKINISML